MESIERFINISQSKKGESLDICGKLSVVLPKAYSGACLDVCIDGKLKNMGDYFVLKAASFAKFGSPCALCLIDVDVELDFSVEEYFAVDEIQIKDAEQIFAIIEDEVDILSAIMPNLLMNIPMKVVCSEDCLGLCPACGINLNTERCDCLNLSELNPQMEGLLDIFKME